ncbi:MAG: hypothetical protein GX986_11160, partial [Firmicutes bacterium]|nr:hypothetical protein [Bacillota bacterium]
VGAQQLELTITDSDGAVVRRSRISQLGGEWRDVAWDGMLQSGEFAAPGLYHYQIMRLPQREPIAAGLIQVAHDDEPPGSSSIRGKITKADVGYGAVGAQVVLYTKKRRQVATAFTEPNGMYEFSGLPEGEYYIEASLPGYIMAQTGVLHLGSGAVQEVNLALLPNRALDLDIQLLTRSVAVGDVLEANVRITNSGTRDLLDTVVILAVPVGFAYGGSDVNHGTLEVADTGISLYEIRWTTGFLKQGESLRAKMWFVVGLDAPRRNGNIRGQALGFAASEKVVTPTISRELEVTAGPFIATSPHSQIDGHVALPVGETGLLEVLLQPKSVLGGPILPFQETEVTKYVERSDLVPLSQPVEFDDGLLAGHALRMRLDGKSFVTEGGLWHHTIGGWGLPSSDVSIVGVKAGAKLDDDSILRSFYGLPKSWPMYSLHPADNTSGPFQLPKAPVPWGRIDVKIVSWDATREMWQEEGPVLFRIDHARGALTLGRAIGAFNTLGDRQYILVIYEGQELGLELSWREISLALDRPNWGLVAGYLETGDEGRIKLVTLGGRLVEDRFRLQANLRTLLGEKPRLGLNPWDTDWLSEGQEDVVSGNTNSDQVRADGGQGQIDARNGNGRSAWQIIGALEPHPKTRVGGGWSMDSGHLGDFWGLTTPYDGRQGGTDSLTTLGHDGRGEEGLDELVLRLEGELVRERRGMSPGVLLKPLPAGKHWVRVLAGEVDLGSGLVASLVTGKSSLLISQDQSPSQREQNIAKGWEQSFIYKRQDWPIWSLGYGQRETGFDPTLEKDKSHYGFLAVDGQMEDMEWGAKLTLSQSRTPRGPVNTNPIRATADLRAQYEVGGLRPYVRGSHQVARDRLGASQGESQEDWTVGLEGQISDQLRVDVAHNQKQDGRSTKEQLALQAAYEFSTGWSLLGTCQWPIGQSKDELFPWQGTIGLRGEIGLAHVLDVGWGRSFGQGITTDTVSIDEVSVGVRTKRSQGVFPYSEIKLNSRLHDGRWTAWELQGEGGWRLGSSWEAWTYGGYKQVIHGEMDP